jgi:glycerate kinase
MKIVVAMDSFKGSLTAERVCKVVAESISSVAPQAEIIIKPMADGGEGTARAMLAAPRPAQRAAGNGQWIEKTVAGPLPGMRVCAGFAWFAGEKLAVVEMATSSGLQLLSPQRRNPLKTTTYGTGQLMTAATDYGAQRILLAVGGSATVDGGTGAAVAMGWKFLDKDGKEISFGGGQLLQIDRIIPPPSSSSIVHRPSSIASRETRDETRGTPCIEVLCDVDSPLCGEQGAAKVYGPQKGATQEMVEVLEAGLEHLAELVQRQLGCDIRNLPGAGAAGGLAAGAVAFMGAKLVRGIETVISWTRLDQAVAGADWVITGEGCFDEQSLRGKVVSGVARAAKNAGAKVAVLAGQVLLTGQEYRSLGVVDAFACMNDRMPLEFAMRNAEKLLAKAARDFALKYLRPSARA